MRQTDSPLGRNVSDYKAWLENERGASARTVDDYERILWRMCEHLDKAPVDVTTDDLRRLRDTYPAGSRYKVTAVLKAFCKWMYQEGRIDVDPAGRIRYPKKEKRIAIEVFSADEIRQLHSLPLQDRALVMLLLSSGIRKSEARALQVKHVDLESGLLTIVRGKGGKGRIAPIVDDGSTVRMLAELLALDGLDPDDHLWYSRLVTPHTVVIKRDKQLGPTSFQSWWTRCLWAAGVPHRKAHTTRHTYATNYIREGGSTERLQKNLGHSSVAITVDIYGHLTDTDTMAEVERVRELIRLRANPGGDDGTP